MLGGGVCVFLHTHVCVSTCVIRVPVCECASMTFLFSRSHVPLWVCIKSVELERDAGHVRARIWISVCTYEDTQV